MAAPYYGKRDPGSGLPDPPDTYGLWGDTGSDDGAGVVGYSASDHVSAVVGINTNEKGVYGRGIIAGVHGVAEPSGQEPPGQGDGVLGTSSRVGVRGAGGGIGVFGSGDLGPGRGAIGVFGTVDDLFGSGVAGDGGEGVGVSGESARSSGVIGFSGTESPVGFAARNEPCGVQGISDTGPGVRGVCISGYGVEGVSNNYFGVVWGHGFDIETATNHGFLGGPDFAGWFSGKVNVTGALTSGPPKQFKIDHPLDPANKYLNHASVESPEMKTVYDGIVTLDGEGEAVVELPEWFESLNKEFRYQLTPIGAPGRDLYVAEEIYDNQFRISGGSPAMKVSWQVTGIRRDRVAEAHPFSVEEEKPADEREYYLYPELYGEPKERGIDWMHHGQYIRLARERSERGVEIEEVAITETEGP